MHIEVLEISSLLIEANPKQMHPHRTEIMKFGWGKIKREETKPYAFRNVACFLKNFEAPPRIGVQVCQPTLCPSATRKMQNSESGRERQSCHCSHEIMRPNVQLTSSMTVLSCYQRNLLGKSRVFHTTGILPLSCIVSMPAKI